MSTLWRDQQWTLSQTGNWARDKEDRNGDGDFVDTGEVDDTRTHNVANEMLTRDTDSNASVNYTLTHDEVGNMTDDGKDYKFVYDAFGRLKTVKNQSNTVVAEYTYNGLNMRIGWHYDADTDADVDANDPWYSFALDDRWRIVATFRGSDTSPKELFAYHNAGMNGRGSSSYIDSVILRNKDANTAWTSASDATLEERIYYVQNWRADVSAILTSACLVKEWVKYTSYGIPIRIDPADYNRDGFVNGTDFDDYGDDFDNARAEADVNFDGVVNGDDYDLFSEWWDAPSTAGRFTLSASSVANRIGYAGYQYDPTFVGASRAVFHVRNRVYDAGLGRWTRRDPVESVEGESLYCYSHNTPSNTTDHTGLAPISVEFNAFIPAAICFKDICDAWTNYWLTVEGLYAYLSDNRGFGSPGTSRLYMWMTMESTEIGIASPLPTVGDFPSTRLNRATCATVTGTATPTITKLSSDVDSCSTWIEVAAEASNPVFFPDSSLAPPILMDARWSFTAVGPSKVRVSVTGNHTQFPWFEALVRSHSSYFYKFRAPWNNPLALFDDTIGFWSVTTINAPVPLGCGGGNGGGCSPSKWIPGCRCLACYGCPCNCCSEN